MFRNLGNKFKRFMYGRYGSDKLNVFLLALGVVMCLLSGFSKLSIFGILAYIPLLGAIFRMYSRNIYKRRKENQAFLQFFLPLRDRQNRYFSCPRCRKRVRVPRGKGKVLIKCPACGERFQKKT